MIWPENASKQKRNQISISAARQKGNETEISSSRVRKFQLDVGRLAGKGFLGVEKKAEFMTSRGVESRQGQPKSGDS